MRFKSLKRPRRVRNRGPRRARPPFYTGPMPLGMTPLVPRPMLRPRGR